MKVYVDVFYNKLIVLYLVDQFTVITSIVSMLILINMYVTFSSNNLPNCNTNILFYTIIQN